MREGGLAMNSTETLEGGRVGWHIGGGGGEDRKGRLTWLPTHDWIHPGHGYQLKCQIYNQIQSFGCLQQESPDK